MRKKPQISAEDLALFHQAMKGTKPLVNKKIRITPPAQNKEHIKKQSIKDISLQLTADSSLPPVLSEAFLTHKHTSISDKTLRKLRKGQYNVEATLDLHGLTVERAQQAVEHFLTDCLQQDLRVVLIIHGKGYHSKMPVLKNKLNQWLRAVPQVLAFCSATPTHGSRGAMYVLLKGNPA